MKKPDLTVGGWVRLIVYIITVLTGLVAVVAGRLGYDNVHEVAVSLGEFLLILSGGTAATNIGKAPDQAGGPLGQLFELLKTGETRVIQGQALPHSDAAAPESTEAPAPGLPTYDGPTTAGE